MEIIGDIILWFCNAFWQIALTAAGAFLGLILSVEWSKGQSRAADRKVKLSVIAATNKRLIENLKYIKQSFEQIDAHDPPTFSLDTTSLAVLCVDCGRYLSDDAATEAHGLRFELEHINNKFDLLRHFFLTSEIIKSMAPAQSRDAVPHSTTQIYLRLRQITLDHLTKAKKWVETFQATLQKEVQ